MPTPASTKTTAVDLPPAAADHEGARGPGVFALGALAVVCGTALMGMEMAGARLVEPFLGNTIYVWGSIIGVFMGALSCGYFLGGRVADRWPRLEWLGVMVLAAGLCCFAIPAAAAPLCQWFNKMATLDPRYRALFASLILFFLPSALLGVVSPFVLRLAARRIADVGKLAGTLYAVSSVGSIVGTFLVSFYLVECVGNKKTVWGVGVVLALAGVYAIGRGCIVPKDVPARANHGRSRVSDLALTFVALAAGMAGMGAGAAKAWEPFVPPPITTYVAKYGFPPTGTPVGSYPKADVLEVRESAHHHITIIEGDDTHNPRVDGKPLPARYMLFNHQIESGIDLARPSETDNGATGTTGAGLVAVEDLAPPAAPARTACGYVDMLHLGMVASGTIPKRILVIGCGGGVGPMMFRDHFGEVERVDVVDIDRAVFELAEKYFGFPFEKADPVIRAHVDDGRLFMQNRPEERWDYIIMDAYTSGGRIPKHLITKEFFDLAQSRLNPGGLVLGNIISGTESPSAREAARDTSRLFRSVYRTMRESFSRESVQAGGAASPGADGQILVFPRWNKGRDYENIIMAAFPPGRERIDSTAVRRHWDRMKRGEMAHLELDDYVARVRVTPPEVRDVPLLTDDFCPTDSMTAH